jgi:hypothetical protein
MYAPGWSGATTFIGYDTVPRAYESEWVFLIEYDEQLGPDWQQQDRWRQFSRQARSRISGFLAAGLCRADNTLPALRGFLTSSPGFYEQHRGPLVFDQAA